MPWITDAQMAGVLDEAEIHQTWEIKNFLAHGNEHHFILVASKGMGKTTLMRLKREQLQKANEGITLIPNNAETDIVSLPSSPDGSLKASLEDVSYWRALWEAAIMISVVLNSRLSVEVVARQKAAKEVDSFQLPREIVVDLMLALDRGESTKRKPSEILDSLLGMSKGKFELFRKKGLSKLSNIFRDVIASGCAIFIDSLDQEIEARFPKDLKIWKAGQLGLMRASWELNRKNPHVKIFVSIRQEAWASYVDPTKNNIVGSAIIIKYNDEDLREIFKLGIKRNDGNYSIEEFFGFSELYNHFIKQPEDIFDFLKRHTIGVPRWLAILGNEISGLRAERGIIAAGKELDEHQRAVAVAVNFKAAALANDYLQSEMGVFFDDANPVTEVKLFLSRVGSTVLSVENVHRLTERYEAASLDRVKNLFCLLINLGLVGHTRRDSAFNGINIYFRMPYEFESDYSGVLPKDKESLYFLHPCMHKIAEDAYDNFRYYPIRISNRSVLSAVEIANIKAKRFGVFVSYSGLDWDAGVSKFIETLEDVLNERGEFVDIWIDRTNMEGGESYLSQMTRANKACDFMIFCASRSSVMSEAVLHEVAQRKDIDFQRKGRSLFTVIIDDLAIQNLPNGLSGDHVFQLRHSKDRPDSVAMALATQMTDRTRVRFVSG